MLLKAKCAGQVWNLGLCWLLMQVVKCRVLSTDISHQRLKLSLTGKKSNADGDDALEGDALGALQPGDIVRGAVREIETAQVIACRRFISCIHCLCKQGKINTYGLLSSLQRSLVPWLCCRQLQSNASVFSSSRKTCSHIAQASSCKLEEALATFFFTSNMSSSMHFKHQRH